MKEHEALKLALEALKTFHYAMIDAGVLDRQEVLNQGFTAATVIKEILAQPELCKYGQEPKSCTSSPMDCQCAIDATFAQPEQEPVAWNVINPTGEVVATESNAIRGWARIQGYKPTVEGLLGFHERGWRVVPATTPPQRKPLTDEEIAYATAPVFMGGEPSLTGIARAIEAAHGIKE